MLYQDDDVYIKDHDICLALKAICHKSYSNLQVIPVFTHFRKNLLIDFVIGLPISAN